MKATLLIACGFLVGVMPTAHAQDDNPCRCISESWGYDKNTGNVFIDFGAACVGVAVTVFVLDKSMNIMKQAIVTPGINGGSSRIYFSEPDSNRVGYFQCSLRNMQ